MESHLHCSLAWALGRKENPNDANSSIRDCLEKSEATSTSATLETDQRGFRDRSVSGPGICCHFHRAVLDDNVKFGDSFGWWNCLVWRPGFVPNLRRCCRLS